MIKCLCINDSNKPNPIPKDKWVEKGKEYTILFSMTVLPQKQLAFQLNEIDLDDSCSPYTWFLANRFSFSNYRDIIGVAIHLRHSNIQAYGLD